MTRVEENDGAGTLGSLTPKMRPSVEMHEYDSQGDARDRHDVTGGFPQRAQFGQLGIIKQREFSD